MINYKVTRFYLKNSILTANKDYNYRDIVLFEDHDFNSNKIYAEFPLSDFTNDNILKKYLEKYKELKKREDLEALSFYINEIDNLKYQIIFDQLYLQLSGSNKQKILINGFISFENLNDIEKKIIHYKANSVKIIKLKLGRKNFDDDIAIINFVKDLYPDVIFKFDVNGAWNSLYVAEKNISKLLDFNFEYIEDPTNNIEDLSYLNKIFENKIAIDEFIRDYSNLLRILENENFSNIVIKPFFVGGMFVFKKIKNNFPDKKIIISSFFETNIGINYLMNIASMFENSHGLGTINLYENEILSNLYIKNGFLINY